MNSVAPLKVDSTLHRDVLKRVRRIAAQSSGVRRGFLSLEIDRGDISRFGDHLPHVLHMTAIRTFRELRDIAETGTDGGAIMWSGALDAFLKHFGKYKCVDLAGMHLRYPRGIKRTALLDFMELFSDHRFIAPGSSVVVGLSVTLEDARSLLAAVERTLSKPTDHSSMAEYFAALMEAANPEISAKVAKSTLIRTGKTPQTVDIIIEAAKSPNALAQRRPKQLARRQRDRMYRIKSIYLPSRAA